ncbi:MAG: PorV/PorQ family protein [Candidatus Cloacimonetes bacterium]|nr:PorV/PorQ family protein [Candidatus Cloacimonadota bacterium]
MTRTIIAALLLAMLVMPLAAIHDDAGTTGFNFLKVTYSARAAAMGNAYTGLSNDADAVFFNPAGLVEAQSSELATSYLHYFDGFQGGSLSFLLARNPRFRTAVFTKFLTRGDITRTVVDDAGNYAGEDGTYAASNIEAGLSVAFVLNDVINLGLNAKFIRESIDGSSASAALLDVGILHQTTNENLKLGLVMRNLGTQLSYFSDAEYDEGMPLLVEVGFSYQPTEKLLANLDIYKPMASDFSGRLGVEYRIHQLLDLRGGYNTDSNDWRTGGGADFLAGISMGFGVHWRNYVIDYAASSYGDLGLVHQFSIRYSLR